MILSPTEDTRAALVIAHPGHELRVHAWLERVRPQAFVLTDGSGHSGNSRLRSTTTILERAGAEPGPIYGRLSDREIYQAILSGDVDLFTNLASELAVELVKNRIECVAGDAVEGYNPGHDLCRLIVNAAVKMAEEMTAHEINNLDFVLTGRPGACPPEIRPLALWLDLDEAALNRKLEAAYNYPELAVEVEAAIKANRLESFSVECLRPVRSDDAFRKFETEKPYYEKYGEQQVAAGHYREVIRYRNHIAPVAEALQSHAVRKVEWADCAY